MKLNKTFLLIILLNLILFLNLQIKANEKISFSGYIKILPGITYYHTFQNKMYDNIINSRLRLKYYANDKFTFAIQSRNRIFMGDTVKSNPGFSSLFKNPDDIIDLSTGYIDNNSLYAHIDIDRFWLDYYNNKLQITIGRQRINWGINFVWNPNDIFNTYSYYDFDYEEKPGVDGIRIQYYTGVISKIEFAVKAAKKKEAATAAMLLKIHKGLYDFQFISGIYKEKLCIGTGWTGQIKDAGFKGELTYFNLQQTNKKDNGYLIGSMGVNYTFQNSLYLNTEFMYNSNGDNNRLNNINMYNYDNNINSIAPTELAWFFQSAYDITPIIRGDLSFIYYPEEKTLFSSPTLSWSALPDLDILLYNRIFFNNSNTIFSGDSNYSGIRIKYSF